MALAALSCNFQDFSKFSRGFNKKNYEKCRTLSFKYHPVKSNLEITLENILRCSETKANGGQGEIRTHGTLARTAVFKTAALNHSATCP